MSEETAIAGQKLESSTEHAKKAIGAAADATKAVGSTVKKQAQSAYETGKEHLTAAAKDLSEAATATYQDIKKQASAKTDEVKGRAQAALGEASTRAKTYQEEAESYIRQNPLQSVGIAVGVGFLLGIIFRR